VQIDSERLNRKGFSRGILFVWVPIIIVLLPIIVGAVAAWRAIDNQKAIGLGAVAGGFSEAFATLGIISFVAAEISGCVLLSRSLSRAHGARSFLAVFSICIGGLTVLFTGITLWVLIHFSRLSHSYIGVPQH
jgi:hypothetical protein